MRAEVSTVLIDFQFSKHQNKEERFLWEEREEAFYPVEMLKVPFHDKMFISEKSLIKTREK